MTESASTAVETEVTTSPIDAASRDAATALAASHEQARKQAQAIEYLESEFPEWTFGVEATAGWNGRSRELWQATQSGHHPQRELTPAKLYRRLDDYEERERQRRALAARVL